MSAELYTAAGFIADTAAAPVALADFLAAPGNATSVVLEPDSRLEGLLPHLNRLERITIRFPKFNDGRGYSLAARLRVHHGYAGRLRATGEVLTDQIQHFFRTGFDELEVSHGPTLARLKSGVAQVHSRFMQPAIGEGQAHESAGQAYSWRRGAF